MRKPLATLLVCLIFFGISAAPMKLLSARATDESPSGTGLEGYWYLQAAQAGKDELDIDMTIVLNEDGSARIEQGGESTDAAWSVDGTSVYLAEEGEPPSRLEITEDGSLMLVTDAGMMEFGRKPPGSDAAREGDIPIKSDVTASDFDGDWRALYLVAHGYTVFFDDLGVQMLFTIKDGRMRWVNGLEVLPHVSTVLSGDTMFVIDPTMGTTYVINILIDGTLSVWLSGQDGVIYCVAE